jgi:threonine aldolase
VIAACSSHPHLHETGAFEATGHKINAVETKDGKLYPHMLTGILEEHASSFGEHMVNPKMVFVS